MKLLLQTTITTIALCDRSAHANEPKSATHRAVSATAQRHRRALCELPHLYAGACVYMFMYVSVRLYASASTGRLPANVNRKPGGATPLSCGTTIDTIIYFICECRAAKEKESAARARSTMNTCTIYCIIDVRAMPSPPQHTYRHNVSVTQCCVVPQHCSAHCAFENEE